LKYGDIIQRSEQKSKPKFEIRGFRRLRSWPKNPHFAASFSIKMQPRTPHASKCTIIALIFATKCKNFESANLFLADECLSLADC